MNKHKHEVRSFTAAQPFSVRTLANGQKQVAGYAIVWNSRSVDLGGFTEICSPGMLNRTLRENPDVLMLRDHKTELLLGRTSAGTLSLNVDNVGLAFTVTLPATAIGDDTAENVRLRNLSGCSFGFNTVDDSWAQDADGNVVRTLLDIDLLECSITSFPAYQETSVNTRSRAASMRTAKRDEDDEDDDRPECDPESPDFDPDADCAEDRDSDDDCEFDDDDNCVDDLDDEDRANLLRIRQLFNSRHQNLTSTTQ
ncbi:MAG TPA: HK97 family phage prohead protease [Acidobacteriaceae bacterium]|jgi:hypothetical protein